VSQFVPGVTSAPAATRTSTEAASWADMSGVEPLSLRSFWVGPMLKQDATTVPDRARIATARESGASEFVVGAHVDASLNQQFGRFPCSCRHGKSKLGLRSARCADRPHDREPLPQFPVPKETA